MPTEPQDADPLQASQEQQLQQSGAPGGLPKPVKRYRRTELEEEEERKTQLLLESDDEEQ